MIQPVGLLRPQTLALLLLLALVLLATIFPEQMADLYPSFRLGILVLVTAGAVLAAWDAIRIRRRMKRLSLLAEALKRDDYGARSKIKGNDALANLARSIDQAVEHIEDRVERLQTSEERIRRMAYHDPLTDLPNRRLFQELLVREIAQAKRSDTVVGVVIMDLDNFKDVNDSLGHTYGDLLLISVAKRLQSIVREDDLVARLGGDEFALLLTRAEKPSDLLLVTRRLLSACRQPFQLDWREVLTSASIGVSFYPQDGAGPEALMRGADTALHESKSQGRNNVQLFDRSMNQVVHRRLQLEQDLRRALKGDEFYLDYQPLIALDTGKIAGLEALVRWRHPEQGVIRPDVFIPLAEETGMMPSLGLIVLELACRQIVTWQGRGVEPPPISVNVSVRQLQTGDFVGSVGRVLSATGVAPHLLQFEITENIALEGTRKVMQHISGLKGLGARVAIDDFGTGYSSFSYLVRYAIDAIKIDRSFVAGIPENPEHVAVVRAIVSLGTNLGLKVVAEGIETQTQLEVLRREQCHFGQGYLLGKPQSPDELRIALDTGHMSLSNRAPVA